MGGVLLRECERLSVDLAKGEVGELRSLLRFLFVRGLIKLALAESVPPVAGWRDTRILQLRPRADVSGRSSLATVLIGGGAGYDALAAARLAGVAAGRDRAA